MAPPDLPEPELLVAMFPANVHHAASAPDVRWDDQLLPATLMQVVFVGATTAAIVLRRRARRVGTKGADTPFVDVARSERATTG